SVDDPVLVNALQRHAAVVLQKSSREGFGLSVTEAMWKGAAGRDRPDPFDILKGCLRGLPFSWHRWPKAPEERNNRSFQKFKERRKPFFYRIQTVRSRR